MPLLTFSSAARVDLLEIAGYTVLRWGEQQALRYVSELENLGLRIAQQPLMGRACDEFRPGLRRAEHSRHVIYYQLHTGGIRIVRILHKSMLPQQHLSTTD